VPSRRRSAARHAEVDFRRKVSESLGFSAQCRLNLVLFRGRQVAVAELVCADLEPADAGKPSQSGLGESECPSVGSQLIHNCNS
jgi:hypothetical protein